MTISKGEVQFVIDIIGDLTALSDPSEYLQDEVEEALEILKKLPSIDLESYINYETEIKEEVDNVQRAEATRPTSTSEEIC